jgi:hypothetical protein
MESAMDPYLICTGTLYACTFANLLSTHISRLFSVFRIDKILEIMIFLTPLAAETEQYTDQIMSCYYTLELMKNWPSVRQSALVVALPLYKYKL